MLSEIDLYFGPIWFQEESGRRCSISMQGLVRYISQPIVSMVVLYPKKNIQIIFLSFRPILNRLYVSTD